MIRASNDVSMTRRVVVVSDDDRRHVHLRTRPDMCVRHPAVRWPGDEDHPVCRPYEDEGRARRRSAGEDRGRHAYAVAGDDPSRASRGHRPSRIRGGRHSRTSRIRGHSSRSDRSSSYGRHRYIGSAARRSVPRCPAVPEGLAPARAHRTSREIESLPPRKSTGALVLLLPMNIGAVMVPRYLRRWKR